MMRAAEQGLRKNQFKIEIYIKPFSYSVKFEVHKKNLWALQKYYSCVAAGLRKKSGTLRWLRVQQTEVVVLLPIGVAIEKMC